jgi:hypothetical protein
MSLGFLTLVFVLLITVISLLRSALTFEFLAVSLLIFGNKNPGLWLYSLIFLPGTILHELSHWLVAELLGVHTGEITILPNMDNAENDRQRLGSVATASSGPIRGFLIGAAPFVTGLLALSLLGYFVFLPSLLTWQYILILYGIVVVGSSMMLSREDRRSLPFFLILVVVIVVIYLNTPYRLSPATIEFFRRTLASLNQVLGVTVGLVLGTIGVSYGIRRIIEKITGKKIARR